MLVNIIQNTISSFRSALAAAEVITTNLKMWLGFETSSIDGDSQITPDKSGNNNVGELFTGKALDFNGSTDYVNTTGFEMAGTSFTFAFWIYPKATTYQFIMDLDVVGTDQRSILALYNNVEGTLVQKFGWYNNPGGFRQFGDPIQNEWQRVVFRVNATTVECYVNGVQSGTTQSLATSHNYSNINNSVIAGRNNLGATQRLDSSLSDFQIYNAYWSTDDIAFDYANPNILVTDSTNTGTSIAVTNLKAYWAMSEGAGSLAYDSSGEGNNGTINGATYEPAKPRIPQLGMMNWSKGSNLYPFSEDFENSDWIKNAGTTITNNYATSPNGDLTAARYLGTGASGLYDTFTLSANSYTLSFYVKSNTSQTQLCRLVGDSNQVSSNLSVTTDWNRISYTFTASGLANKANGIYRDSNDNDLDILIWGAQLEESSSAGAYRLTDGGATRNSTVIPNPTIPTKDIFGNLVRDRLNSFNLDGSGYATNETLPTISSNISLSFWVKLDTFVSGNLGQVLGRREGSSWLRVFRPSSSNLKLEISATESTTFNVTENQWVYVAITINSSNQASIYVDNSTASTVTFNNSFVFSNTIPFTVGAWLNPSLQPTSKLNGLVSDVLIYDRVLTSDEVENNYNAGLSAHTN